MLDIQFVRENQRAFDENLAKRGFPPQADQIVEWDAAWRAIVLQINQLQEKKNQLSQQIRHAPDNELLRQQVQKLKEQLEKLEPECEKYAQLVQEKLITLPNILMPDVPLGKNDEENVELMRWGKPRDFAFTPKQHFELGESIEQMDFKRAAKISGARFVVLRRDLARLHRALGQFMLNLHVDEHDFEEVAVPYLVRPESMMATAHLPKFDNGFCTQDDYWLIPSAEVSLINLFRDEIIDPALLPLKVAAFTPCFRSEAGAAGRDTRGMIRMHQFHKVELVTIAHPQKWRESLDETIHCAEKILRLLELPYRQMQLCSGDCAVKETYAVDGEVWFPGQNRYREVCTWACTSDYQSRRANIRINEINAQNRKIHPYIIYGSGTAIERVFAAILENYQQENGSIAIPAVLQPLMKGQTVII